MPDKLTAWGLLLAVSDVTVSVAVAAPHTKGSKTTLIVHVPPGAIEGLVPLDEVLQVSVSEKRWLLVTMVVTVRAALPVFVRVMVWGALGPPPVALEISTSPKLNCAGDKLSVPMPPWPAARRLATPNSIKTIGATTVIAASRVLTFQFCTGFVSVHSDFAGRIPDQRRRWPT